jgi:hypothetical protein
VRAGTAASMSTRVWRAVHVRGVRGATERRAHDHRLVAAPHALPGHETVLLDGAPDVHLLQARLRPLVHHTAAARNVVPADQSAGGCA